MKHLQILVILLLCAFTNYAQTVHLDYKDESLDKVLLDIRDDYGVDLSFGNSQLSKHKITVNKSFSSAQEALEFLLIGKPFELQKFGDVYIIKQSKKIDIEPYILSATIIDKNSGERLPYAHLLVNNAPLTTNQNGDFSVKSKTDSLFQIKVSYLGFYLLDTTLVASANHKLMLRPVIYEIEEIKVSYKQPVHKTGETSQPGAIRLNSFVSSFLPGNGDQSVFNLLRLQPGILAAGEQSSDLLIWGSYEGQSKLILDGVTLFSMKNYNDNISTINPLIVKDLNVFKGGYGIEYNDRVGGVVDVTGKEGNRQKLASTLNINNQTINGEASVPLFKHKSSLLVALRQTYYELYDQSNVTLNVGKNENSTSDRILYPDYNFRDFNTKLSGDLGTRTSYQFNFLHGKDDFIYALTLDGKQSNFIYEDAEQNTQNGWSAQINHNSPNGMASRIRISSSMLTKMVENHQQVGGNTGSSGSNGSSGSKVYQTLVNDQIENHVEEQKVEFETQMQIAKRHYLKYIMGLNRQQTSYVEDSVDINIYQTSNDLYNLNFRIKDNWAITEKLNVTMGLLYERILKYNKDYLQPRINLSYKLHQKLNVSFAYGIYNQFVTQLPQMDDFDNIRYFWMNTDFDNISVQKGIHKVLAFNYHQERLKIDINFFQRNITGLTRYSDYNYLSTAYKGEGTSNGIDFLFSATLKRINFWAAYTYSKTLEHFDYLATDEFVRALHDQRHELKGALIYSFKKWHFSANYVYGSGFPELLDEVILNDYQRLDVALNRAITYKKINMNVGFSILNLLNYQNIKYDNFYRLEDEEGEVTLHAQAVPFTPTLYFNLSF